MKNQKRLTHCLAQKLQPIEQLLAQAEVTEADLEVNVAAWEENSLDDSFGQIFRAESVEGEINDKPDRVPPLLGLGC